jgi:hypothetical protein
MRIAFTLLALALTAALAKYVFFGAHAFGSPPAGQQEALEALQGLKSVTDAGVNYTNYAPRVLDAKIKVDRYLAAAPAGAPARAAIALAMHEFVLASQDWNASIGSRSTEQIAIGTEIMSDKNMAACPSIQVLMASSNQETTETRAFDIGPAYFAVRDGLRPLWQCAALSVADAARLAR